MQTTLFFIKQHLTNAVRLAAEKAQEHHPAADPFLSELNSALSWFTFSLPQLLPLDGITQHVVLPHDTDFRLETSTLASVHGKKRAHKLIKEVKGGKLVLSRPLKYTVKPDDSLAGISKSLGGAGAFLPELMRWNGLGEEGPQAGQKLWLVNPDDELVKDLSRLSSGISLEDKNPHVLLSKLSPAIVNKYLRPEPRSYFLLVKLCFRGEMELQLNPSLLAGGISASCSKFTPASAISTAKVSSGTTGLPLQAPFAGLHQAPASGQGWELVIACKLTDGAFVRGNASDKNAAAMLQAGPVSLVVRQQSAHAGNPFHCGFGIGRSLLEGWSGGAALTHDSSPAVILTSTTALGEIAAIAIAPGGLSLQEKAGAAVREVTKEVVDQKKGLDAIKEVGAPVKKNQEQEIVTVDEYEELAAFRKRSGLPAFDPNDGSTGTTAMVIINGKKVFGLNSGFSSASKALRQEWFDIIQWVPPKTKQPAHLGHAQSLTHAEAHSLMRANKKSGAMPEKVTMYVDRITCNMCRGELPALLKATGIKELTVFSGGSKVPIKLYPTA